MDGGRRWQLVGTSSSSHPSPSACLFGRVRALHGSRTDAPGPSAAGSGRQHRASATARCSMPTARWGIKAGIQAALVPGGFSPCRQLLRVAPQDPGAGPGISACCSTSHTCLPCQQVNKLEITADKTLIAAAGNPHIRCGGLLSGSRACAAGCPAGWPADGRPREPHSPCRQGRPSALTALTAQPWSRSPRGGCRLTHGTACCDTPCPPPVANPLPAACLLGPLLTRRLYEVNSSNPQPIISYDGHSSNVTAVGFQKDGKWMYTGSEDGTGEARTPPVWLLVPGLRLLFGLSA